MQFIKAQHREKLVRLKEQAAALPLLQYVHELHLWIAASLAALLFASSMVTSLVFSGEKQEKQALESGQRAVLHIASGEVDGTPRHTKRTEATEPEGATPKVGSGGAKVSETFDGKEGLAAAPLDTITEQTDKGLVPTTGKDGTLPWKYYSRPHAAKEGRPMVALLFTNLGLSKPLTEEILKLPHTVTLSFSPYAADAKSWAKKARGIGFESLIDLPVEPSDFPISDPGPYGLLTKQDGPEMSSRLHWLLSRYPGYVGTLATANEKMTASLVAMRPVLMELTARGVLFIYKKTEKNTELADFIVKQKMLAIGADMVADENLSPASIIKQLNTLAEKAKANGHAIAILHAYPPSMKAVSIWAESAEKMGIDIVPVSAIGKKVFP